MNEPFSIGLIQPRIDPEVSWNSRHEKGKYTLNIDPLIQERVWKEIETGIQDLYNEPEPPRLILIPELHLPHHYMNKLKKYSKILGSIIIAGIDFERHPIHKTAIRNRALITIPNNWPGKSHHSYCTPLKAGKTFFTYMERSMFNTMGWQTCPESNMYIFETGKYGDLGFVICSDIFDIERLLLYQGKITHLIIIALNKDVSTYYHMAEAVGRTVYCNVIICNTGFFGGSFVFSPYKDHVQRTIYKHEGSEMYTTQVINVPVVELQEAQEVDFAGTTAQRSKFKASPPGYPRRNK